MFRFSVRPNRAHLVNWREWGPEAFRESQEHNKLPVLFLTAFWCGFCQRMDEGALSDDEVIALLNAFFVPMRVEESQRPDVDLRYNQDGWPTIVFLTPSGDHLFSVNYTDTEEFINILARLVSLHQQDREALFQTALSVSPTASESPAPAPLGPQVVAEIAGMVEGLVDQHNGGFGGEFKFFQTEAIEFLLYLYQATGQQSHFDHARLTMHKMRGSKTYDHESGGFFRYSSKGDWSEPHPEKMLEDQASLLRCYLHAYLLTGEPFPRQTAEELISYLDANLFSPEDGAFFGCQDYVRDDAGQGLIPVIDQYIYCDANAKAASAYLGAWWTLGRDDCKQRAQGVLEHLWGKLRNPSGGVFHYYDGQAQAPGILTDLVAAGSAFLDAYGCLHDPKYLERGKVLAEDLIRLHRNPTGGFLDISAEVSDKSPASLRVPLTLLTQNAGVAAFFVRLADLSGQVRYRERAVWALKSFPNAHREHGAFAAGFGHALARLLALPLSVTITGKPGGEGVLTLARAALTQLGHGDLVLNFQEGAEEAHAVVQLGEQPPIIISDPAELTPGLAGVLGR